MNNRKAMEKVTFKGIIQPISRHDGKYEERRLLLMHINVSGDVIFQNLNDVMILI